MCLLGATYLFEDNRRGWVKAERVFVVRGRRGVPCRDAGRCGHLIKDQPGQGALAPLEGGVFRQKVTQWPDGAPHCTEGLEGERGGICRTFCLCSTAPPPDHLPWPEQ